MSPYTINAEETSAAAGPPAEPVLWHLALVSGPDGTSLDSATAGLKARLAAAAPADAPTRMYNIGTPDGSHRGAVLAGEGTAAELGAKEPGESTAPVAFMFPGLGDHYQDMGRDLYRDFPVFRAAVDSCAEALAPELGLDIREVVFPDPTPEQPTAPVVDLRRMLGRDTGPQSENERRLNATRLAQPALFVIEYSLAKLWESWGTKPAMMIGYSLGEYVCATLAGVLSLKDALTLVARRAALIDELPKGSMLAVMLPEDELRPLLSVGISLSAVNGPEFCVAGGPTEAIAGLEQRLTAQGVVCRRVTTTHAFHTQMMSSITGPLTELARTLTLNPPRIPYISNVTGAPITDAQATDPGYWSQHLVSPVRFADGLRAVGNGPLLLETGPGQTLSSMATVVRGSEAGTIVAAMRHPLERHSDSAVALKALGRLWLAHADIDWDAFPAAELIAEPDAAVPDAPGASAHEASATEAELHGLWAKLLKTEQQLPYDIGFFEVGGNSLLASRLILRINRTFGVELTLRQVYEWSTLTRMAAAIDTLKAGGELIREDDASSHTAGSQARFRLPNGLEISHQNEAETLHFYEDIFDHRTYAKNGISIPDGATVVDVGGNIGLFTLFAHYEAKDVRVFTFEPAPPMFKLLSQNAAEHNVNAQLFNIGISDSESQAQFTFYPRSSGMSSFHPDEAEEKHNLRTIIANQQKTTADADVAELTSHAEELMDVRFEAIEFTATLRPLSAVIREQGIERIDLIKIDVQKSERQVIDGIADEDWPKIQQMVLEAHDADGEVARLVALLQSRGFTARAEQDELYVGTDIHNIYAVRGTR
ncbi:FkbM family methyltransferase [Streptomyces sp. NBC_01304]|uniref:FkbM family methyltransferase n=1 Tax=Streptomyces sp. NBC_01304 TaxID=2903818 RepID=UPI002E113E8D|nr:FkbM family methyltransferase [Streptomyces sp. NBC_01304]